MVSTCVGYAARQERRAASRTPRPGGVLWPDRGHRPACVPAETAARVSRRQRPDGRVPDGGAPDGRASTAGLRRQGPEGRELRRPRVTPAARRAGPAPASAVRKPLPPTAPDVAADFSATFPAPCVVQIRRASIELRVGLEAATERGSVAALCAAVAGAAICVARSVSEFPPARLTAPAERPRAPRHEALLDPLVLDLIVAQCAARFHRLDTLPGLRGRKAALLRGPRPAMTTRHSSAGAPQAPGSTPPASDHPKLLPERRIAAVGVVAMTVATMTQP